MRRRSFVPTVDGMPPRMTPSGLGGAIVTTDASPAPSIDTGSTVMAVAGLPSPWDSLDDDGDGDGDSEAVLYYGQTPPTLALPVTPVIFIASFTL